MSINENGILPSIVSITSLMENSKHKYVFYIIVDDPNNIEFNKLKTLEKIYNRLNINIINHSPRTDELSMYIPTKNRWPISACYRLWLPELLPHIKRIIHIDYDCLIRGDLAEMYKLDMENLNIRGIVDPTPRRNDKYVVNNKYICSGVILMNLERMRRTNVVSKYEITLKKFSNRLQYPDQTIINSVDIKFNDFLPLKYGILFFSISARKYYKYIRAKNRFKIKDFNEAMNDPIIAHLIWKPC